LLEIPRQVEHLKKTIPDFERVWFWQMVWKCRTLPADLIKPEDPESKSKKHARYVPFWA
jgi:hypothetical protein